MVKTNKLKSFLAVAVRILAFLLICTLLYFQLGKKNISLNQIEFVHFWPLLLVVLCVPINWFLEYKKWLLMLQTIGDGNHPNRLNAFYAGMVTGLLTPAMAGNFLGRIYYFEKGKRLKLSLYTLSANFAQFSISIIVGALAFVLLARSNDINANSFELIGIICFAILCLLFYFFGELTLRYLPIRRLKSIAIMVSRGPSRANQLGISFLRYLLFITQFSLCIYASTGTFSIHFLAWIALVFMVVTITPSLFLGKIVVRESIAVAILGIAGIAPIPVLLSSLSTWLLNLIIPAIWASLKIKKING